ncbi:MAG: ABC transporter ATP-binding protein [Desulfobacter sp.]|nr:ABC transporter ATP-binding protein [Desulfobacter sp.]WDP85370.1 MAG: ABC transporter ATP-binding protein [Desulfobacter sp.]
MNSDIFVKMIDITKTFGSVVANKDVSFEVKKGDIYALLGENGAGKSTLMNMLSGIYRPDKGSILVKGKQVGFNSPKDAIKAKIGMIHQHFKLVEVMTAAENIILGQEVPFFLNRKKLGKKIKQISDRFGLNVDPNKKIYNMSVGEKQNVEILKVLFRGADILILDEPTAVLTPQEVDKLFDILRKMKEENCAIIIITHKLNEVMSISDWVSVMRKGKSVGSVRTRDTSPKHLTDLMVGKAVNLSIDRVATRDNKTLMEVENLSVLDKEGVQKLKEISFTLASGEILGVAGVAGSGQKELCEAIVGLEHDVSGKIIYKNENILGRTCRQILKKGISMSFIPEDRLGMGLVSSMDIINNTILRDYYKQSGFFLNRKPAAQKAECLVEKLNIYTPGIKHPVKLLSGGNIQKVLLGREIDSNPTILITAYPTRGLDIGSSHLIYDLINEQKQMGVGILYVGEDLDVLMELCDRIIVLCHGKITGTVKADTVSKEEIGLMMAGKSYDQSIEFKGAAHDQNG